MEFVTITTSLWDDSWVIDLTPDERLLWLYLCTSPNNDNGFIEYSDRLWRIRTGLEAEQIAHALAKFERAGKIARDGDMVLVVKHLGHRRLRGNNLKGAVNAILKRYRERYPQLVSLCFRANPVVFEINGVDITEFEIPTSDHIRTDQIKSDQLGSASDTTPSTDPILDLELHRIIEALRPIVDRGQWRNAWDAQRVVEYLQGTLSKEYPYVVILEAARRLDTWLRDKPKEKRGHQALRKFCQGVPAPAAHRRCAVDDMELIQ